MGKNDKRILDDFLINNRELEILESRLSLFNPFNVLKIENYEIRHSNVLAWLINPKGNHNLNDFFVKKVLSQMISKNEETFKISLSDVYFFDFNDGIVKREDGKIDILFISEKNKILFLIENKIYSKESKNQMKRYLEYTKSKYPGYEIISILLTRTGDEPEIKDEVGIFTHDDIYKLLEEVISLKENTLQSEVISFIKFYLKTLQKTLRMDEDIKNYCLKIYDNHKDAIDLINIAIQENKVSLKPVMEILKKQRSDFEFFSVNNNLICFLPKELLDKLPKVNLGWVSPYPLVFWISKRNENRLKFVIEIGLFSNGEKRSKFMNHLEINGYKISSKSKDFTSKYTRILSVIKEVKDFTDHDAIAKTFLKLYDENMCEVEKINTIINDYDWDK